VVIRLIRLSFLAQEDRERTAVSYLQKKVLILPVPDALSPITGGVGGGLTLWTTSNKKLLGKGGLISY